MLQPAPKSWKELDFKVYHLGTPGQPEWLEFAQDPPHGRDLALPFVAVVVLGLHLAQVDDDGAE